MSFITRNNFWYRMLILFCVFIVACLVLIASVPFLLSTSWGKTRILEQVNSRINGKIEAASLNLQWMGTQTIEGLSLKGEDDKVIIEIPSLQINTSLISMIRNTLQYPLKLEFNDISGQIHSDSEGRLNLHKALNFQSAPSQDKSKPFTLQFSHMTGSLALLEHALMIDLKGQVKNPEGLDGAISLNAKIENEILTLNQPLKGEFAITPELSKYLLKDTVPLLGAIVSAESKAILTLDSEGFSYPLEAQNYYDAEIGKLTLELGKVVFDTKGQMTTLVGLLQENPVESISIWFTPIYLDMHDGKVDIKRLDMLVLNKYPIASWGSVDFPKDKIHLTLGLSEKALESITKGAVNDKEYMFQIHLKGKIGQVNIDKSKFAKQIAALAFKASDTLEGLGLGFLSQIAKENNKESPPPAPTTTPFPWESHRDKKNKSN